MQGAGARTVAEHVGDESRSQRKAGTRFDGDDGTLHAIVYRPSTAAH